MSAFHDYCIVCEKLCDDGSVYCCEECRLLDQKHSNSPTLSICSGLPSVSGSFSLDTTNSTLTPSGSGMTNSNSTNSNIPTLRSPLLTPQVGPRCCVLNSIKSPTLKDLTYESPLLKSNSHIHIHSTSNDLDSNSLDLNISNDSIAHRLSTIPKSPQIDLSNNKFSQKPSKNVTDISNMLRSSSENYKKWLSIH